MIILSSIPLPIGIVIDAAIHCSKCDASALVVESGNVKRKALQKLKRATRANRHLHSWELF